MLIPPFSKFIRLASLGCALLVMSHASAQSYTFSQLGLNAGHEDNVSRGVDGRHEEESSFLSVDYTVGRLFELGLKNTLVISGTASASKFSELSGFDKAGLGVSVNYNYKWALGAYAPILSFSSSYGLEEYEGEARDNGLLTLDLSYLKRLSPAWFVSFGADYQKSDSKSLPHITLAEGFGYDPDMGLPFDLYDYESSSIYGEIEYAFENGLLLSSGFRRVDGFTVSSTTQPTLALYKVADGIYVDPAFSGDWLAYQLEADTNEWSLGLSVPSGLDSSININYSHYDITAVSGGNYLNNLFSISYVHNF